MNRLPLLLMLGITGCSRWQAVTTPLPEFFADTTASRRVRLTPASGEPIVMEKARLRSDSIHGLMERKSTAQKLAGALLLRSLRTLAPSSVAARDIVRLEVRQFDAEATGGAVVLFVVGTAAAAVILAKRLESSFLMSRLPLPPQAHVPP